MTEPILRVEGLVAGYGAAPVLRGVDLTVPAATIVAVLGANGAGKTTLLRTISGLVVPTAGRVALDGADLRGVAVERLVRMGMAHVPEGRGVVEELTVEENLRLGGLWRSGRRGTRGSEERPGGDAAPDSRAEARRTLDDVYGLFPPLAARRGQHGHQLSGGERQMLALGRALMARPRLLLLDEPSLGLAPRVTAQILATLRRLRDETGLAVLLVEQNVRSALSVADQGIVMSLGTIAVTADAAQLRGDVGLRHAYLGF